MILYFYVLAVHDFSLPPLHIDCSVLTKKPLSHPQLKQNPFLLNLCVP